MGRRESEKSVGLLGWDGCGVRASDGSKFREGGGGKGGGFSRHLCWKTETRRKSLQKKNRTSWAKSK